VTFRKKLYNSLEEIQVDLDEFMGWYNTHAITDYRALTSPNFHFQMI
jgi:hypothetical protein